MQEADCQLARRSVFRQCAYHVDTQPWERRPKAPRGDTSPHPIFYAVGLALTLWETIEGEISIAYIGLLPAGGYRADKYFNTPGFESRHKLVRRAIEANVNKKDCSSFVEFMDTVLNYSRRRHEIGICSTRSEDGLA